MLATLKVICSFEHSQNSKNAVIKPPVTRPGGILMFKMMHNHKGKTSNGLFDPEMVLDKILKEGDCLLDAGCGSGFLSIPAAEKVGEYGKVFAVDCHADAINELKQSTTYPNLIAMEADIVEGFELPQQVDIILVSNVFHGFVINEETDSAMNSLLNKLKPGGTIAFVEFLKEETKIGPPVEHRISSEELDDIMSKFGVEQINYFDVGKNSYCAVYQKQ